ncbi:MAG: hypothetical protein CMB10_03445 [Euryarchaeota archaeon]|nr:hypothetical protein [Euryarchaeota archaeon]|tara:strand:+ start:960 stop:1211 length:252 start_codon:yes stop_codon:yes gene_type:complete
MAVDVETIRQLPKVDSVEWIKPGQVISDTDYQSLRDLLQSRKRMTLIGKNGCVIIASIKEELLIIQSQPNVNLGSIDLILDSI